MRQTLTLLVFALSATSGWAQGVARPASGLATQGEAAAPTLRFQHFGLDDGLSQSSVFTMLQDRQGFMWFGTQDGLNRYDGHRVTIFRTIPFDSSSLASNWILALAEGPDGALWIGTLGGLERRDPRTGQFRHYGHDPRDPTSLPPGSVSALHVDPDGTLWVGMQTEGLARLDGRTGRFRHYRKATGRAGTLSSNAITTITRGVDGALWVGTGNGINRLAAGNARFISYLYDPNVQGEEAANQLRGIGSYLDDNPSSLKIRATFVTALRPDVEAPGVLWAATQDGLVRLDARTGAVRRERLGLPAGYSSVHDMLPDPRTRGVLWASTTRGLYRFDMRTGRADVYHHDPNVPSSLSNNTTARLYADRAGLVWVVFPVGVDRFDPAGVAFQHLYHIPNDPGTLSGKMVYGIGEDREGYLWIGTRDVLNRLDPATGVFTHVRASPNVPGGLSPGVNQTVYVDRTGAVWSGKAEGGVDRLDPATGRVTHFMAEAADPKGLEARTILAFFEDRQGRLWAGSGGGLLRFNPAAQTFAPVALVLPGEATEPSVSNLIEDHGRALWITTEEGLRRLDPASGRVTGFQHNPRDTSSLASNALYAIHERPREPGVLWIGTVNAGLDRFDTRTGRATHFTEADGLPNGLIYGILEDTRGHLWLSTNNGLADFDPERRTFVNYSTDAGLQSREFNANAYYRSARTGEMYFGGINGLNRFYPERVARNPFPPQVALTGLRLFGRPVPVTKDGLLTAPLSQLPVLRLGPSARSVTLEFAALHFQNPAKNRTQYRLEGFDPAWQEAGGEGAATYTNLSPGRYRFAVRGANSDGVWSAPVSLAVVVLPPWWRSWWAYGLYVLMALALLLLLVRAVRHRARLRERERVREERERAKDRELQQAKEIEKAYTQLKGAQAQLVQQEKLASLGSLTAGIAHEIKNPLNFVNNFASLSAELVREIKAERASKPGLLVSDVEDVLDDLEGNVTRIEEHGKRADSIVKGMLMHARAGSGQRETVAVNALVDEAAGLAYHGMRAQRPDFTCTIELRLEAMPSTVQAVPQDLSRVVLNLVGNALYAVARRRDEAGKDFTPTVRVSTRADGEHLEASVWDNGGGIPEAVRQRIFEPFFTTKPAGEGTGLGLSLSNDIVAAHGGSLSLETEEGAWTCFTVRLPVAQMETVSA